METKSKHPCFDLEAKNQYARIHLPVAPKCNIQCNYCHRKYDCVNESRPGVTSAILSPMQALYYLKILSKKINNLSVVGIAGPGDPFANPVETMATIKLVRKEMPDVILCVSSNGLDLVPYINELADQKVSHVTITMNSDDPEVLGKIYSWVRYNKKIYRNLDAGHVILEQQLKAIQLLKKNGITVKINSIVISGINDNKIQQLSKTVSDLGADVMNIIPMFPVAEAVFGNISEPSRQQISKIRIETSSNIKPMTHCARCRADAAGLLGMDDPEIECLLKEALMFTDTDLTRRPRVAVATHEGLLVNQHLGETRVLYIFEQTKNGYRLVEQRKTPDPGCGDKRWEQLSCIMNDCRALLVSGIGENPQRILSNSGIHIMQMTGLIDIGLDAVYKNIGVRTITKADLMKCGNGCKGNMKGCA